MITVMSELDAEVLQKIAQAPDKDGYRALDLINELKSHSASDIQKAVAALLVEGKIQLTTKRRLKQSR